MIVLRSLKEPHVWHEGGKRLISIQRHIRNKPINSWGAFLTTRPSPVKSLPPWVPLGSLFPASPLRQAACLSWFLCFEARSQDRLQRRTREVSFIGGFNFRGKPISSEVPENTVLVRLGGSLYYLWPRGGKKMNLAVERTALGLGNFLGRKAISPRRWMGLIQ